MSAIRNSMVDRFLSWKLPRDFSPDNGITFAPGHTTQCSPLWPTGTNLLNANQVAAMVECLLGGLAPDTAPQPMSFHVQELRPEVLAFALLMEQRLREKDADKGQGWKKKSNIDLTVNVCVAARHMEEVLFPHKGEPSIKALVDMSNHCMMLADVLGALDGAEDGGAGWAGLDQVQMS